MNFKIKFLVIAILLNSIISSQVNGQRDTSELTIFNQLYSAAEKEYGINQELVNGVNFENIYSRSLGHPYFEADTFKNGSVVFRGKKYSDLLLKYNSFNQQLVVKYIFNDVQIIFYLPMEFVSEYNIENKKFEKHVVQGEDEARIYQIIGEKYPVKIKYRWERISYRSFHNDIPSYAFSLDRKTSFVVIENNLVSFRGNGSFTRKFPEQFRKAIKEYIHSNSIKVKQEADYRMERLIEYINSLYNS